MHSISLNVPLRARCQQARTATINEMYLPILSAFLGAVAFLPANFYSAVFIFLAPLFLFFLREEKFWRLIGGTVVFWLIFDFGTVYFTLEPFLWASSLLLFLGLPTAVWIIKKISARFLSPALTSCFLLIFLPFAFTFFDHLEARYSLLPTYIKTAGNALGSSPFIGLAGMGGLIVLTFFAALINTLIVAAILQRKNKRNFIFLIAAVALILFSGWLFSYFKLHQNFIAYNALSSSFAIAVVSTNNAFASSSFAGLVQELKNQKTDLIVFPEDIFNQQTSSPIFQNTAKDLSANVLAAYDTFQNGNKYNSAILFDAQGNIAGIHNKNRLTFIGEYWPFGDWQPSFYKWLREKNPRIRTYAIFGRKNADSPGERNLLSATFKKNVVLFAAPICLEAHYLTDLEEYRANGARFIVNQSSNRWVDIGLNHYLYLTDNLKKIASVRLGLPIISSGVDDFAGIILPDGQTQMAQTSDKNYSVFFGTIRY